MKWLYLSICAVVLILPILVSAVSIGTVATVTVNPPSFTVSLNKSWNLVSFPLKLGDKDIESVLGPIMEHVVAVNSFDDGAKTYSPLLPPVYSDLEEIDHLHGYWIKVTEGVDLTVSGARLNDKAINLGRGWNLISYLCDSTRDVTDVFGGIMGKVVVISGFENGALIYRPDLPEFSNLDVLKPGLGYWVKTSNPAVLDYEKVC